MGIEISKTDLSTYLSNAGLNNEEIANFNNSIFDKYDVEDQFGNKVEQGDGKLTNGEFKNFFDSVIMPLLNNSKRLNPIQRNLIKFVKHIQGEDKEISCNPKVDKTEFDKALKDAKDIILRHANELNLTQEELDYINNARTISRNFGSAEYDRIEDTILFNYNGAIAPNGDYIKPNVGNFVKILIHESTHMSINSSQNSQEEERRCETRGLQAVLMLYEQHEIDDFQIIPGLIPTKISDLKDKDKLDNFVNEWIRQSPCYNRLPENIQE